MEKTIKENRKILLFQRILPHYRIPLLRNLSHQLDIVICYSREKNGSGLKSEVDIHEMNRKIIQRWYLWKTENIMMQNVVSPILNYRPKTVICEGSFGYITFWMLLVLRKIFGYKLIAWTHGVENKLFYRETLNWKSRMLLIGLKLCDAVILYSRKRKEKLEKSFYDSGKLYVANNTIHTNSLLDLQREFSAMRKISIRKKLGWIEKFHLIFIGRLLEDKRIDLLLDAFKCLSSTVSVGLHIVGKGPELKLIKDAQKSLSRIYYHGEILDDRTTGEMLFTADLLVNPGYVGLSIVHGFCFGKPIVTCRTTATGPFHSPEIEYLRDNENGIFCESSIESIRDAVLSLLMNPEKLCKFSESALITAIEHCSEKQFIDGFKDAINYCDRVLKPL